MKKYSKIPQAKSGDNHAASLYEVRGAGGTTDSSSDGAGQTLDEQRTESLYRLSHPSAASLVPEVRFQDERAVVR